MVDRLKGKVVAELKIPVWSLLSALVLGLFHIGMTYQQFNQVREQAGETQKDVREMTANLSRGAIKQEALDERSKATDNRVTDINERLRFIEQRFYK